MLYFRKQKIEYNDLSASMQEYLKITNQKYFTKNQLISGFYIKNQWITSTYARFLMETGKYIFYDLQQIIEFDIEKPFTDIVQSRLFA